MMMSLLQNLCKRLRQEESKRWYNIKPAGGILTHMVLCSLLTSLGLVQQDQRLGKHPALELKLQIKIEDLRADTGKDNLYVLENFVTRFLHLQSLYQASYY